jgi:hydrogenase maturation protease
MSGGAIESAPWLVVIGYGNELRGDDGAGPKVARTVGALHLPGVKVLAVHTLTPEIADEIASAELVLFVDASASLELRGLQVVPLTPAAPGKCLGHSADPCWLLTLTAHLHGQAPQARLLRITAPNLDFGEQLSSLCQRAVEDAVKNIARLVQDHANSSCGNS